MEKDSKKKNSESISRIGVNFTFDAFFTLHLNYKFEEVRRDLRGEKREREREREFSYLTFLFIWRKKGEKKNT